MDNNKEGVEKIFVIQTKSFFMSHQIDLPQNRLLSQKNVINSCYSNFCGNCICYVGFNAFGHLTYFYLTNHWDSICNIFVENVWLYFIVDVVYFNFKEFLSEYFVLVFFDSYILNEEAIEIVVFSWHHIANSGNLFH